MSIIVDFICALFLTTSQVYAWYRISNEKFKIIDYKKIILIVILTIFSMINFKNINPFIKTSTMIFMALAFCKILLNKSAKETIIIVTINFLLLIVAESIFGLLLVVLSNSGLNDLFKDYHGTMFANIAIAFIIYLLSLIKLVNTLYLFLIKHTIKLKNYQTLIFLFALIFCCILGFTITYYTNNKLISFIVNIGITIVYAIIVFRIIKTKNMYISINEKYISSLDNLTAQETIINDYRILNHENKNQLLTIQTMTKNKKVKKYIDEILKQKKKLNSNILDATINLPNGGIKGLITQKIINMKQKKIKYYLRIDKGINSKIINCINDRDNVDLCQILGVLIDNAIEASENIYNKEIIISIYKDNNYLNFEILNNYENIIKYKKGSRQILTNKGEKHGYGLQLVKRIIKNNNNIINKREISKNTFKQIVIVKIK